MSENAYANLINSGLLASREKKDGADFHPAAPAMESAAAIFARRRAETAAWRPGLPKSGQAPQQPSGIDVAAIFAARRSQTQKAATQFTEEIES